jgi:hypothetical protein
MRGFALAARTFNPPAPAMQLGLRRARGVGDAFIVLISVEAMARGDLISYFQYIVTTMSRPSDDLASDERVRLKLNGSPAEARLLGRDL